MLTSRVIHATVWLTHLVAIGFRNTDEPEHLEDLEPVTRAGTMEQANPVHALPSMINNVSDRAAFNLPVASSVVEQMQNSSLDEKPLQCTRQDNIDTKRRPVYYCDCKQCSPDQQFLLPGQCWKSDQEFFVFVEDYRTDVRRAIIATENSRLVPYGNTRKGFGQKFPSSATNTRRRGDHRFGGAGTGWQEMMCQIVEGDKCEYFPDMHWSHITYLQTSEDWKIYRKHTKKPYHLCCTIWRDPDLTRKCEEH